MNPFLIDSYNFKSEQLNFVQVVKGLEETLNPAKTYRDIASLEEKVMGAISDVRDAVNKYVYFPGERGWGWNFVGPSGNASACNVQHSSTRIS